jgi:ribonuclease-3
MTKIKKPKSPVEKLFQRKTLFTLALTHKSWVNEHKGQRESNERLEFLGDAVLEFIVSRELFKKFPAKEEGYLTALRANLVNTVHLAEVANKLNLGSELYLSKGEEEGGGRKNSSLLADTVEAVIGALYLDRGISVASKFIKRNILDSLEEKTTQPLKDAKSRLQEHVQAQGLMAPKYEVVSEEGPDHDKKFTIKVVVDGKSWGKGVGKNKAEADQQAAIQALKKLS